LTARRPRVYVQQPIPPGAEARLRQFADVEVFPHSDRLSSLAEAAEEFRQADYVFALGENPISDELLEGCENLGLIAAMEIFPTQIDFEAATRRGIPISGLPHDDEITETTAEFTVSLLLSVAWGIPRADSFLRSGKWVQYQSVALPARRVRGASLGIVGLGKIGKGVARRAVALGMNVSYFDINRLSSEQEANLGVSWKSLGDLAAESDFIAVCVLLTKATEGIVGETFLQKVKPGSVLINTSRGRVVDEEALIEALESGRLAAAGIDVFVKEPPDPAPGPANARLADLENVILTPHIGTSASATREWMANYVVTNIENHLAGMRPAPILNPEVFGEPVMRNERIG
jgi:phosphoglycerate dehydrogenase-like enzyme